jgi:hypothetical protein
MLSLHSKDNTADQQGQAQGESVTVIPHLIAEPVSDSIKLLFPPCPSSLLKLDTQPVSCTRDTQKTPYNKGANPCNSCHAPAPTLRLHSKDHTDAPKE